MPDKSGESIKCPQCGRDRSRRYCKHCKAEAERRRYAQDPERERERKRREYRAKADAGKESLRQVCQHDDAIQDEQYPGTFFCPSCGAWLNTSGELVVDPTTPPPEEKPQRAKGGSNAGKASGPEQSGAKRAYQRDPSKMVTAHCAHPGCKRTWKVWPQNYTPDLLCPELHLPLLKQQQARERQRRHRQQKRRE